MTRRRNACASLLPVLLMIAYTPGATAGPAPDAGTRPIHSIPMDDSANWVVVPVRAGESAPLRCILDTGMPSGLFLFDPELGKRLGLRYAATVPVQGAGKNTVTASIAMGETLTLGGAVFENQRVIVLTEAGELAEMGIDGVIGATVFNEFLVEMRFDTKSVELHAKDAPDKDRFGEPIPMTVTATKPYIDAVVRNADGKEVGVTLLIDSGANTGLDLHPNTKDGIEFPATSIPEIVASGVGGKVVGVAGRVPGLKIGGYRFENTLAGFSEDPVGAENGIIGMDILRRFNPTFDYSEQQLRLRPSESFGDPFEFNMLGVQLRPQKDGGLYIRNVVEGSPASEQGVLEGDVILTVDGESVIEEDHIRLKKLMQREGESILLTLRREGEIIHVTCVMRRLI